MSKALEEDSRTNGRWTKEEHDKFILGLQIFGKDWKKIQALIGTRNGAQIRSHAQKFFIKNKKDIETSETNENWEQTKESPPEYLSSLHANAKSQEFQEKKTDSSYYFSKMYTSLKVSLKKDLSHLESFDFWNSFVDFKEIKCCQKQEKWQRKSSFLTINRSSNEKQGLLTTKRIKVE